MEIIKPGTEDIGKFSLTVDRYDYADLYGFTPTSAKALCVNFPNLGRLFDFIVMLDYGDVYLSFDNLYDNDTIVLADGSAFVPGVRNDMYVFPNKRRILELDEDGNEYYNEVVYSYEVLPYAALVGTSNYISDMPKKPIIDYDFDLASIEVDHDKREAKLLLEDLTLVIIDFSGPVVKTFVNFGVVDIQNVHYAVIEGVARTWLHKSTNSPHTDWEITLL